MMAVRHKSIFRAGSMDSLVEIKAAWRRVMREKLRVTSVEQRAGWSRRIVERLQENAAWVAGAGVVALFGGMKTEVDLLPLMPWLRERGVEVVFFCVKDENLVPWRVRDGGDLVLGRMGVLEPLPWPGGRVEAAVLDVVLTPGLAFDVESGARLGRGRGHYDRLFAQTEFRARKVGIGYECQCVKGVPVEGHDGGVAEVVSEQAWRVIREGPF